MQTRPALLRTRHDRRRFPTRNDACRLPVPSLSSLLWLGMAPIAVAQTCTVSLPTMAFGNVDVLPGTAVDTMSTMVLTCSGGGGVGQRLCISIGVGSAGDATSRKLNGPSSNTRRYDIYSDAARTQLWGSWQTGYDTAGVSIDVPQDSTTNVTVYARLFGSQQTAAAGAYSSTFATDPFIQYRNNNNTPCPAGGKTASSSTAATATVVSSCNVSATTLNFGTTSVLASNVDATSTVTLQCNNSLPYAVALDGGTTGATDPTLRKMSSGANRITYGLYRDAARSLPWGSTTGTNTASGTGTGSSQGLTVYGRVPAQATPQAASYQDTIVVTVTY